MTPCRSLCLGALLLSLVGGSASAQVQPKILIIFDTSGSMLQDSAGNWQLGDGSQLCTGKGKQSRIYQLKQALFEALQGMGANEVDFALATFPMFMDATRDPYCALGAGVCSGDGDCRTGESCKNLITGSCASDPCPSTDTCVNYGPPVGKVCVGKRCVSPCETPLPSCSGHYYTASGTVSEFCATDSSKCSYYGCKVSSHTPATQTSANCGSASCPWYNDMKSQVLQVPFGSTPEQVLAFFDQKEAASGSNLANPEVRAGNAWYTPLGKSLFYAHGYFNKEVVPQIPAYEQSCTTLAVAFFTDGAETCNDQPSDAFYPTKWAQNLNSNMGVVTHTVAIDVNAGSCTTNANCQSGYVCHQGSCIPATLVNIASSGKGSFYDVAGNSTALKQAFLDIIAQSLPPTEVCDNQDNDCDGASDEDFPLKGQPCDNGKLGVCHKSGTYICSSDGSGVTCNAADVSGTGELCNGLDDDCNGAVDDVSLTCSTNSDCAALGQASCVAGNCACTVCIPQPEVCNGIDDDCDSKVDEDFTSQPCGLDLGECKPGNTACEGGKIVCKGGTSAGVEQCNGLDDDCDGIRDGMSESCYTAATGCTQDASGTWTCEGFCKPGLKTCQAQQDAGGNWSGVWTACSGAVGPATEICNGQDDDCDGDVDDGAECPGGGQCIEGNCSSSCASGEFVCPKGQICQGGWCVKDPCDQAACEAQGGLCKAGECINPCKNVTCGKYETCVKGACVDQSCYNPQNACPQGQICIQGQCVADPCDPSTVTCAAGEFCVEGQCVKLCDDVVCPEGQVCKVVDQGGGKKGPECVDDPCGGRDCPAPWVCIGGKCVDDPCATVGCETGQVCVEGKCIDDPCETVSCPPNFTCQQGECINEKVLTTTRILASGSGGLACAMAPAGQQGPTPAPLGLVFALALLMMVRSVRRD